MKWTTEQLNAHPKRASLLQQTATKNINDMLVETFKDTRSLIKTAERLNLSTAAVEAQLMALGEIYTDTYPLATEKLIVDFYAKSFTRDALHEFCTKNKLAITSVTRWAFKAKIPIGKRSKTESDQKRKWKQGWFDIGTRRIYMRSRWEVNYAFYLEMLIKSGDVLEWDYEPKTFWFDGIRRGTNNYKPDFKVTLKDGSVEFHEVKGYLDAKSKTKIKRMAKYHPKVKLVLRDKEWFKAHRSLKNQVPGWICS